MTLLGDGQCRYSPHSPAQSLHIRPVVIGREIKPCGVWVTTLRCYACGLRWTEEG